MNACKSNEQSYSTEVLSVANTTVLNNELQSDDLLNLEKIKPAWKKQTIWECFEESALRWPMLECLQTNNGVVYTYDQLYSLTNNVANSLMKIGVKKGMKVALRCVSSIDFILLSLSLYKIGAVKVALSGNMGSYELSYKLKEANVELLIEDKSIYVDLSEGDFDGTTLIVDWADAYKNADLNQWKSSLEHPIGMVNYKLDSQNDQVFDPVCSDEMADIFFTSGSTGKPKAVPLTHDMMLRSAWANALNRNYYPSYRLCVPLPVSHVYGYIEGFLSLIQVGGTLLIPTKKMRAISLVSFLQETGANDILLVPNLAISMVEYLEEHPTTFPQLNALYCSASACPDWLWPAMKKCFDVKTITTGYGMTEVCGASFQLVCETNLSKLTSTVGKLIYAGSAGLLELNGKTVEYKVVEPDTGSEVSPLAVGELCCRGASVFRGYLNNPEANSNSFDSDGWFHTGDLGSIDDQGFLRLTGRTSETYKINGENVSPRFVEKILGRCDIVRNIRIVGVPELRYGEVGAAFIELLDGVDPEQGFKLIKQFCKSELARYQIPKYYFFVKSSFWPLNDTDKVSRPALKERALKLLKTDSSIYHVIS